MILQLDSNHPDPRKIARAVEALAAGEVIGYPTDTVYALGCDPSSKKAVDRLYQLKEMPKDHPLALLCADLSNVAKYAVVDNQTYRILKRYLPGPYCFVLEATRELPRIVHTKRKTIGIRVPDSNIVRALTSGLGRPLVSTTAAKHGGDPYVDAVELDRDFRGLGLVLDSGGGGLIPTTVIDLTSQPPSLIREGLGPIDDFVPQHRSSLRPSR